jgi:8-oxo-dGTP pyrophosphatase MutT (NUDIX family)
VVLVEVARYATGTLSLEVPAGGSDGEDLVLAAQRELREETGLAATSWQQVGTMFALNGVCDAIEHVFLARGLRPAEDADESAEQAAEGITGTRTVPWSEVMGLVQDGTITDGETVAALMYAALALGRLS